MDEAVEHVKTFSRSISDGNVTSPADDNLSELLRLTYVSTDIVGLRIIIEVPVLLGSLAIVMKAGPGQLMKILFGECRPQNNVELARVDHNLIVFKKRNKELVHRRHKVRNHVLLNGVIVEPIGGGAEMKRSSRFRGVEPQREGNNGISRRHVVVVVRKRSSIRVETAIRIEIASKFLIEDVEGLDEILLVNRLQNLLIVLVELGDFNFISQTKIVQEGTEASHLMLRIDGRITKNNAHKIHVVFGILLVAYVDLMR